MQSLPKVSAALGVLLLVLAAAGAISGNPSRVVGFKVTSVILAANTLFLLALIAKSCCEKK